MKEVVKFEGCGSVYGTRSIDQFISMKLAEANNHDRYQVRDCTMGTHYWFQNLKRARVLVEKLIAEDHIVAHESDVNRHLSRGNSSKCCYTRGVVPAFTASLYEMKKAA